MYKPYRRNQVIAKLKAARSRLGRLYVSDLSAEVKRYLRNAAEELGSAERLLKEEVFLLGYPIKFSEGVSIDGAVVLGNLGEVFELPLTEQEDKEEVQDEAS